MSKVPWHRTGYELDKERELPDAHKHLDHTLCATGHEQHVMSNMTLTNTTARVTSTYSTAHGRLLATVPQDRLRTRHAPQHRLRARHNQRHLHHSTAYEQQDRKKVVMSNMTGTCYKHLDHSTGCENDMHHRIGYGQDRLRARHAHKHLHRSQFENSHFT